MPIQFAFALLLVLNPIYAKLLSKSKPLLLKFSAQYLVIGFEATVFYLVLNSQAKYYSNALFIGGLLLILIGWTATNWHRPITRPIFFGRLLYMCKRVFGDRLDSKKQIFIGDWFQLIGFSIIQPNIFLIFLSSAIFPVVYIFRSWLVRRNLIIMGGTNIPRPIRASVIWPGFTFIFRVCIIVLVPILLIGLVDGSYSLFLGDEGQAFDLVFSLLQIEATVGALLFALLFLIVELTTDISLRFTKILISSRPLKVGFLAALASIIFKISVLANNPFWVNFPSGISMKQIADLSIIFSILSALGYSYFAQYGFSLLASKERIVQETLIRFDKEWMKEVRETWGARFNPRGYWIERDPLVLTERLLESMTRRGDLISLQASLAILQRTINEVHNENDGPIIDKYLAFHLSTLIKAAAETNSAKALTLLLNYTKDVTYASAKAIRDSSVSSLDAPGGTLICREICLQSVNTSLEESGNRAIHELSRRASSMVSALPDFSDLWLLNPDNLNNMDIGEAERARLWENDWLVDNYEHGYLEFFSAVGLKAIEKDLPSLAWSTSHAISSQINKIFNTIANERFQYHLIGAAFNNLTELVKSACKKRVANALSIGIISVGKIPVSSLSAASLASISLANYLVLLSKAGVLDWTSIAHISVAVLKFGVEFPESLPPAIEAYGKAGEILKLNENDIEPERVKYLLEELNSRIDQISSPGLGSEYRKEILAASKKAKSKTEFSG